MTKFLYCDSVVRGTEKISSCNKVYTVIKLLYERTFKFNQLTSWVSSRSVVTTFLYCDSVVREFELLSGYYIRFRTNMGMNKGLVVIWPIDRTLVGATAPCQNWPESDGNEEVLRIPPKLQHYWNRIIRLFCVISRTLVGRGFTPRQKSSRCILQFSLVVIISLMSRLLLVVRTGLVNYWFYRRFVVFSIRVLGFSYYPINLFSYGKPEL